MDLTILRVGSIVVIALIYMLFDLLNKRNVPSAFAYATLIYALALTVSYLNFTLVAESIGLAVAVLGFGYMLYKGGQLGAADVIELAALSMMMPLQPQAYLIPSVEQLGLPFIFSLIVNAGIAAFIIVPLFYIPRAERRYSGHILRLVGRQDAVKAAFVAGAYLIFAFSLSLIAVPNLVFMVLIALMLIGSALIALFEKPITGSMIKMIGPKEFEEGDIIEVRMMTQKSIEAAKRQVSSFGRLVTSRMISEMKRKRVKLKFPVYRNAFPFAVPLFISAVLSLLFGNLILFIVLH